jgi:hypothetical protein
MCIQSYGIPPEKISQISGIEVPGDLFAYIALLEEKQPKKSEVVLYSTVHLPETRNMYYENH